MTDKVRTRFAPSPTGFIHVGSVYGILFDWAYAKKNKGKFIIRIEDTDQKRKVSGAEENLYEGLNWLGLVPNESPLLGGEYGPYRQSERLDIYKKYAQKLVKEGKAYLCFCSQERLDKVRKSQQDKKIMPRYDRCCRNLSKKQIEQNISSGKQYVIRMKVPDDETIEVFDVIRGKILFDSNIIDDQVLVKSDGFPTYHLAAVVDDHLMKISHVIRGEEWISSFPKHVLLYRYFNWEQPVFLHTPILRNLDKSKMAKRENHASLSWFREMGFLPEALLNFLALLGWSHPEQKEIFSLDEFVSLFDLKDVSPIGPVFDLTKLIWMNGEYIRKMDDKILAKSLCPFLPKLNRSDVAKMTPLIKERIKTLFDAQELLEFLWKDVDYPGELLIDKGLSDNEVKEIINQASKVINDLGVDDSSVVQSRLIELIKKNNWHTGKFFMILRVAVCGKAVTPPLLESLPLLGKQKTLKRLSAALAKLA